MCWIDSKFIKIWKRPGPQYQSPYWVRIRTNVGHTPTKYKVFTFMDYASAANHAYHIQAGLTEAYQMSLEVEPTLVGPDIRGERGAVAQSK